MSKTNFLNMAVEEAKRLAPYAVKSLDSRGRRFPEAEHAFRTVPSEGPRQDNPL